MTSAIWQKSVDTNKGKNYGTLATEENFCGKCTFTTMGLFNNIFPNSEKRGKQLLKVIASGDTQKAISLINKKADINLKNENGQTALILAFEKNLIEITRLLITKGADINA